MPSAPFLRPWSPSDAEALVDGNASDDELGRQFGEADLTTTDAARRYIKRFLLDRDDRVHRAVVVDDRVVGSVGLTGIEHHHGTAWTSYWLSAEARGRGLAARGLAAVADLAFDRGAFRLELGHRVNNPASCAVARRAGFLAEGIERQKLRYGVERFDIELHARLAVDPTPAVRPLPMRD